MGVSAHTGKDIEPTKNSAVPDHISVYDNIASLKTCAFWIMKPMTLE